MNILPEEESIHKCAPFVNESWEIITFETNDLKVKVDLSYP